MEKMIPFSTMEGVRVGNAQDNAAKPVLQSSVFLQELKPEWISAAAVRLPGRLRCWIRQKRISVFTPLSFPAAVPRA